MRIRAIDSHTEGEPTRVVLDDAPALAGGSVAEQARDLTENHDGLRRGLVLEPRGSDVLVGALLVPPADREADAGVIFFNNAGVLGMCVHGTIGVVRTLQHAGRVPTDPGTGIRLETPVGMVTASILEDGAISVENVPSHRALRRIEVPLADRVVHADIAWGGNWFALVDDHGEELDRSRIPELTRLATEIRHTLNQRGTDRGFDRDGRPVGGEVDHVEFFGPPAAGGDSRNFVLCPGGAHDRSPCGTGTSARLACLAADGTLEAGRSWIQESILGSRFTGRYRPGSRAGEIIPTISGRAWITAELELQLDPDDPYRFGID
ncbi:MAG: hydroxyproline-2-epimerase [Phycisphaerae bacterium]|nr:hydroxyproline-2-epimerase [Phycisphaerae bacterium]